MAGKNPLEKILPGMMAHALAHHEDFILAIETDPDTGQETLHLMSGKFISPCMLRKLDGLAASQRDEGSRHVTRVWRPNAPGMTRS